MKKTIMLFGLFCVLFLSGCGDGPHVAVCDGKIVSKTIFGSEPRFKYKAEQCQNYNLRLSVYFTFYSDENFNVGDPIFITTKTNKE